MKINIKTIAIATGILAAGAGIVYYVRKSKTSKAGSDTPKQQPEPKPTVEEVKPDFYKKFTDKQKEDYDGMSETDRNYYNSLSLEDKSYFIMDAGARAKFCRSYDIKSKNGLSGMFYNIAMGGLNAQQTERKALINGCIKQEKRQFSRPNLNTFVKNVPVQQPAD